MLEDILRIMAEEDWFAAVENLNRMPDQLYTLNIYNKLIKHLYYEEKNLPAVVAMARAGIQFGLGVAESLSAIDPEQAKQLLGRTRAISYNLASYTWPGWDETGIEITPGDLANGLDAARVTLRLTTAAGLGSLLLSRSYWILGAQWMAAGKFLEATSNFTQAAILAEEAGSQGEVLLVKGFTAIVGQLVSSSDQAAKDQLDAVKDALVHEEYGDFFIDQLNTAQQIFLN